MWLIGNAIRIYLVGSSLYYLLQVFILQQVLAETKSTVNNRN